MTRDELLKRLERVHELTKQAHRSIWDHSRIEAEKAAFQETESLIATIRAQDADDNVGYGRDRTRQPAMPFGAVLKLKCGRVVELSAQTEADRDMAADAVEAAAALREVLQRCGVPK